VNRGLISVDAPLGRALLGKREGDVAIVQRPVGAVEITIVGVSWSEPVE
jgi:transcription elongation factor GreB